jgi:hypothetical protein
MPISPARWSFLLALPLASCIVYVDDDGFGFGHSIRGSGVRVDEERAVDGFHAIELETDASVVVRLGSGPALRLSGDDNLLPEVTTGVSNGVLHIDVRQSVSFRSGLEIEIETPTLDAFHIEGSGDVRVEGLAGQRVELAIEGSGTLRALGRTSELVASIEGSGDLELGELEAAHARLSIEGSGSMDVRVVDELRYSIEGSGEIRYAGDPEVHGSIDGSGDVGRRG